MRDVPEDDEIEAALDLLLQRYRVSTLLIELHYAETERRSAERLLRRLGAPPLTERDLLRMILRSGAPLLAGKRAERLRRHLLGFLSDDVIAALFGKHLPQRFASSPSYMRRKLSEISWRSGSRWPRDLVRALDLPLFMAGLPRESGLPAFMDVRPMVRPPPLADFQLEICRRMLSVLELQGRRTRCVVTLPTGGGKTRVATQAFIDWMQPRFADGKYLLWIAQSEELCEQAIACIEQQWSAREFGSSLRVYRFFGGRNIQPSDLCGGVVVASIQQLARRIERGDDALDEILSLTGAMIIDEAHRATSSMYDQLLARAAELCGPALFAICGLTATPGRAAWRPVEEVRKLVDRFEAYLIRPELGPEYSHDPMRYFREHGYLARAHHVTYRSGIHYEYTEEELSTLICDTDVPPAFLRRLAQDDERNALILRRLLALPASSSTLVYACTVEHARLLATMLGRLGRTAAAVSAETPPSIRRELISAFKEKRLSYLCNYGVLTTGFDAPATDCIAITRPIMSDLLYEQIVGRGLRGPRFGGTSSCLVIDFADNLKHFGPPMAYARFSAFWQDDLSEGPGRAQPQG